MNFLPFHRLYRKIFAVASLFLAMSFCASGQLILVPAGQNGEAPLGTSYKGGFRTLGVDGSADEGANLDSLAGGGVGASSVVQPGAIVPEPSSIGLLFATGLGAMALRFRRRKN